MTPVETVAREIAARLRPSGHGRIVALTGAGISVESGIPDFRSAGGIWTKYDPSLYATIDAFRADPARVWVFLRELGAMLRGARPNAAHAALAEAERAGALAGVVTQNVDALHQGAGSRNVIEVHGSGARLRCVECASPWPAEAAGETGVPRCQACGGLVKPDVILFGEMLPEGAMRAAEALVREAAALLVIGTSGAVWPVAGLPGLARAKGAYIVELNLEETELSEIADASVLGPAGTTVPELIRAVAAASGGRT